MSFLVPPSPHPCLPGGGQLCFATQAACQSANSSSCSSGGSPCSLTFGLCASGIAAAAGFRWACPKDSPANALPSASGAWCYSSQTDCMRGALPRGTPARSSARTELCDSKSAPPRPAPPAGPSICNATSTPCVVDQSLCPTGISGSAATPHLFLCQGDYPDGAEPTGFGSWCFNTPGNCTKAPNSCSSSQPCIQAPNRCATGVAGNVAVLGDDYSYFCESDLPVGSAPNAGGVLCYDTQARARAALLRAIVVVIASVVV